MDFLSNMVQKFLHLAPVAAPRSDAWAPSYEHVCEARAHLARLGLPTELVLQILDHAQYWPQHQRAAECNDRRPVMAAAQHGQASHAVICMHLDPMATTTAKHMQRNGEVPKVKCVDFAIKSRDQGWTSENTHGTFNTSSWLEVSILRTTGRGHTPAAGPRVSRAPLSNPSDLHHSVASQGWALVKRPETAKQGPQDGEGDFAWYLQGNRVAAGLDEYNITWTDTGNLGNEGAGSGEGFLRELTEGDRVLVWARAKCIVESITMTVHYGL
ncbi:hypothetical protein ACEQ8H_001038 [Pleosporales sp. CAS-2024a]